MLGCSPCSFSEAHLPAPPLDVSLLASWSHITSRPGDRIQPLTQFSTRMGVSLHLQETEHQLSLCQGEDSKGLNNSLRPYPGPTTAVLAFLGVFWILSLF